MIDKFENYLIQGKAKKRTRDIVEAMSLLQRSKKRMEYIRPLNNDTAFLILEDSYESTREAAQSLMSRDGFKPYSHEATISFLRKFYINEFDEYELINFDRFRELRNMVLYQGKPISIEDAKNCLEFAKVFIKKVDVMLNKNEIQNNSNNNSKKSK